MCSPASRRSARYSRCSCSSRGRRWPSPSRRTASSRSRLHEPPVRSAGVVTHDVIVVLALLGVAGQTLALLFVAVVAAAAAGVPAPFAFVRAALWGYELWAAFVVSAIATG